MPVIELFINLPFKFQAEYFELEVWVAILPPPSNPWCKHLGSNKVLTKFVKQSHFNSILHHLQKSKYYMERIFWHHFSYIFKQILWKLNFYREVMEKILIKLVVNNVGSQKEQTKLQKNHHFISVVGPLQKVKRYF